MGIPVKVELTVEDRARADRALDLAERFIKILEHITNTSKEEKK